MPKVLLIRNYAPDAQPSMLRFADMLEAGLAESGWDVSVAEPPVHFGKDRNTQCGSGKWLGYIDKYILARKAFKNSVKQSRSDLVHICDHSNAIYAPLFTYTPTVITCHDLLAVRCWLGEIQGERKSFTGGLQQRWIFNELRQIRHIACVSRATQLDLERLAPETTDRSCVIPVGLNYPYAPLSDAEKLSRQIQEPRLSSHLKQGGEVYPFLLHVGNNSWYKNRGAVIAIYESLLKQKPSLPHRLIMAGAPPDESLLNACKDFRDRVLFLENIDSNLLESLYATAECFIFPSLAEGFGWPPIEAQASGCPIAISNIEPLVSNCGDGALVFDPHHTDEAAAKLLQLLQNPERLATAISKGLCNAERFTAQAMIASYINFYQSILDENTASG